MTASGGEQTGETAPEKPSPVHGHALPEARRNLSENLPQDVAIADRRRPTGRRPAGLSGQGARVKNRSSTDARVWPDP